MPEKTVPSMLYNNKAKTVEYIRTTSGYGYGYAFQEVADMDAEYAVLLWLMSSDNLLAL